MIAMALACRPDLLIADEPTTALDVTLQHEVLMLIDELVRGSGMGLLLISHDLSVMARHVQRVMVMYGGTVVEAGPTAAVFERRAHPLRAASAARPRLVRRAARCCPPSPAACPLADLGEAAPSRRAAIAPSTTAGARRRRRSRWARATRRAASTSRRAGHEPPPPRSLRAAAPRWCASRSRRAA
jgi:peptide/nickel transport system ATP-binding protein